MTPDASFGPFFFPGCYTRRGGFTVVWALVTARGGRGVLGKKIGVSNKNRLVSLHNNNNNNMGQTTVNRRLGPRMLMVVAVSCRRCGSHTVHTLDKCVSNAKKKKKKTQKKREEIYLGLEMQLRLESHLLLKWWWSCLGAWWWWWWFCCRCRHRCGGCCCGGKVESVTKM